jgi:hypothetical protein
MIALFSVSPIEKESPPAEAALSARVTNNRRILTPLLQRLPLFSSSNVDCQQGAG